MCCRIWCKQLGAFVFVLTVSKITSGCTVYALKKPLGWLGDWLFRPLDNDPKTELVVVMICCPGIMNAIQFWVQVRQSHWLWHWPNEWCSLRCCSQDNFLKKEVKRAAGAEGDSMLSDGAGGYGSNCIEMQEQEHRSGF